MLSSPARQRKTDNCLACNIDKIGCVHSCPDSDSTTLVGIWKASPSLLTIFSNPILRCRHRFILERCPTNSFSLPHAWRGSLVNIDPRMRSARCVWPSSRSAFSPTERLGSLEPDLLEDRAADKPTIVFHVTILPKAVAADSHSCRASTVVLPWTRRRLDIDVADLTQGADLSAVVYQWVCTGQTIQLLLHRDHLIESRTNNR